MQKTRVMIVEDEGLIANDIASQLQKVGYEVAATPASGEEALDILQQSPADLILMDIRLKGRLDGIDTALRVRSEHNLPVVFLTSHADSETLARAKQAEPCGYLVKPFRQLNLSSAIETALHKHLSERKLIERQAWLTTVLETTADATIVIDENGRVQFLNASAERLLAYPLPDAEGLRWTEAVPLFNQSSGEEAGNLVQASLGKNTLRLPRGLVLRTRNGDEIPVEGEVSATIVHGSIARAVITLRDVSHRNQEDVEVDRERKMLAVGRLAGRVATDFNKLLALIIGHGAQLVASISNPVERARAEAMLEAAHTAADISEQLMSISRRHVPAEELLAMKDCLSCMSRITKSARGLSVLRTELDRGQFYQALLNLVRKARIATSLIARRL